MRLPPGHGPPANVRPVAKAAILVRPCPGWSVSVRYSNPAMKSRCSPGTPLSVCSP